MLQLKQATGPVGSEVLHDGASIQGSIEEDICEVDGSIPESLWIIEALNYEISKQRWMSI